MKLITFVNRYSWIGIIIVLLVFLRYGFICPDNFIPDRCAGSETMYCIDRAIISKDGNMTLTIINMRGNLDLIDKIHSTGDCKNPYLISVNKSTKYPFLFQNNTIIDIELKCEKFSYLWIKNAVNEIIHPCKSRYAKRIITNISIYGQNRSFEEFTFSIAGSLQE